MYDGFYRDDSLEENCVHVSCVRLSMREHENEIRWEISLHIWEIPKTFTLWILHNMYCFNQNKL